MADLPSQRVLVTDGDTRAALATTRSLGRRGHTVVVASEHKSGIAAASRFASGFVPYPDPSREPREFVAAIAAAVAAHSIDVVLPMTEISTLLLARERASLPACCKLPFAPAAVIEAASDKALVVALARELGVPVPATIVCASPTEARARHRDMPFPLVIKPSRSRIATATGWLSTSVSHARDAAEFESRIGSLPSEAFPVLLQERISGAGVGLFACYDQGRPIAQFAHRRLREKPPSGGVSVLRESVPPDPRAAEFANRLLDRLRWHGVAMVEFKRDDRDGSLRLMEINGRFWGSLQLAIDAGVDFPDLLLRAACGAAPVKVGAYQTGVRSRWFLGDLDVLLTVMLRPRRSLNLPAGYPSRLRLLMDFMRLCGRNLHYEVLTLDDPRPGLVELRRWLFRSA